MKQKTILTLLILSLLTFAIACTGSAEPSAADSFTAPFISSETAALSQQTTLALGTLELENTPLAISETTAAELLPLWQTLQTLSNDDATASAELDAIVNQIERTLSAEQVTAINNMTLTTDTLTELLAGFGGGPGNGGGGGQPNAEARPNGGGGGRGGGGFGGGPGGPPGGIPIDEETLATRQAQRESGAAGGNQERVVINAVIRLLQEKTGSAPIQPQRVIMEAFTAALGLTVEEVQAQFADGQTAADIALASGIDLDTLEANLIAALETADFAQDATQFVQNWLGRTTGE